MIKTILWDVDRTLLEFADSVRRNIAMLDDQLDRGAS